MTLAARKRKACKFCGKDFEPFQSTQKACATPECSLGYVRQQAREQARKAQRRKDRAWKAANKPRTEFIRDAQSAFNAYIRARDHGKPCVSCGTPAWEIEVDQSGKVGGAWDCGHFRTVGAAGHLRFHPLNAHRQCKGCNGGAGKHGHINNREATITQKYRRILVGRIGVARVEALECDTRTRTFTSNELRRIKAVYNRKARHYRQRRGIA